MKVFLIILGVLIALIALWVLFVKWSNKTASKAVRSANIDPLDCVTTNSFMGFQLLDGWEFTLSRMIHLGLISQRDLGNYKLAYQASSDEVFHFETTINELKNIEKVTFDIYKGKLWCIEIDLKANKGQDIKDFKRSLIAKYSQRFGKAKSVGSGGTIEFEGDDGSYIAFRILDLVMPGYNSGHLGVNYDNYIVIGIPKQNIQ